MAQSITLQNVADTAIVNNDILGQICFAAPNEADGTDSILISASIFARSEGTFAANNNATELVFVTAASESAAPGATNYDMTLSSTGVLTLAGGLVIADGGNIGSASDSDALAISSGGLVTFSQGFAVGSDAAGDILYHNGTSYVRLAKGSDDEVLTLASGLPSWAAGGGSARSVAGDTGNGVVTWVTGDNTFAAEANFTFDGSTLTTNSGIVRKVANKVDANYTITAADHIILVDTGGDDRTITLPAATADNIGTEYTIKKTDPGAGVVNITPATTGGYGPDDIDEYDTKFVLYAQHDSVTFVCGDGDSDAALEQWWIISERVTPHHIILRHDRGSAQSIAGGSWVTFQFDNTDSVKGLTFDASTEGTTIKRPGVYQISCKANLVLSSGEAFYVAISKNGTASSDILPNTYSVNDPGGFTSGSGLVNLLAGDVIYMKVYWVGSGSRSSATTYDRQENMLHIMEVR